MTPPESDRLSGPDGRWRIRTFPNKYPALQADLQPTLTPDPLLERMPGAGLHEVIVETPDHNRPFGALSDEEVTGLFEMFRKRIEHHRRDPRLKYLLIFKNHGKSAGASLPHPHVQLIGLPILPKRAVEETAAARRYFSETHRCAACDMIRTEREAGLRVVAENQAVLCVAPFVSRSPFELWLLPKRHTPDLAAGGPEERRGTALLLRDVLKRLAEVLRDPPYNFILHSSPLAGPADPEYHHWHLELMPRLTRVAGFEWGSGFYINPTPPELAARILRAQA